MNVLGIILARGGSTRIVDKNLQIVGGMSMVAMTAASARQADLTDLVVSTDDARIAAECEPFGAKWIRRPEAISGATARMEDAVQHALFTAENMLCKRFEYVVVLQAAVPIRPVGAIRCLLNTVMQGNCRGGVTVVRRSPWMWNVKELRTGGACETWWNPKKGYPRSQDVRHTTLEECNSIQITPRAEALAGKRWSSPVGLLELPKWADHDVDGPEDLQELRDDWPVIAHRMHEPLYRWHMVNHPDVPKVQIPLAEGMGRGRVGVVLGNGPQIDTLGGDFWDKIRSPQYLTVGVNRICCAETPLLHDFSPDIHLIWDSGNRGNPLTDAQILGLSRLEGRSWRLISHEPDARCYPHDQVMGADNRADGPPNECRMWNVSSDAAVNVLYRMGCREVYLYGVEMNDNKHCRVHGLDESKFEVPWAAQDQLKAGLEKWREVQQAHEGMKIFCGSERSKLVTEGVMEFRAIDTGRNYE